MVKVREHYQRWVDQHPADLGMLTEFSDHVDLIYLSWYNYALKYVNFIVKSTNDINNLRKINISHFLEGIKIFRFNQWW